ncbi:hopanoid biosynthesis associated protein HpnK [Selenomonas ruminantium]|uniref:Hopanoid biosynthesis associated protein HpnK n=1 Tax=Selenomonas ruminantium TaxID=971 RepID=A0A1M6VTJ6_SELRU|nr:ChbG/HpnK family deacetylase [Selenomonas ruminantium]SHK84790.1 hopanoid biosynthesis associated protein HpnK [Selenomonas ruminantium]
MMKKLILNADDFGRHEMINKSVQQAVQNGALRSASIMPGAPAFADAVVMAKALPKLGVGVHLTLVDGVPVLPAEQVPTLIDREGHFWPDHGAFIRQYLKGRISRQDVAQELAAQLDKVLAAGIRPTHVDSHQHLHMLPGIFPLVLKLAAERGIKRVRISRGIYGNPFRPWPGLGDMIGKFGLEVMAFQARREAKRCGFSCPEHFVGQVAGGAVTEPFLLALLADFPEGSVEVMLHPGLDNSVLARECGWQHDYEGEYRGVCADVVLESLKAKGIQLAGFADLT